MQHDHIVHAFDDELANLDKMIAEMGGLVETQLDQAINGLVDGDVEVAKNVIANDKLIDQLELSVATQATQIFALRQPMADDLRAIIAALKISSNLERMGDYAKNISRRTITLASTPLVPSSAKSIRRMGTIVSHMIREVLDAYIKRDAEKAIQVLEEDQDVDQLHTSLFRETLTYMMEDPRKISVCAHMLFIAKHVERIGDHATNIAEQIYYVKTGKFIEDLRDKADNADSVIVE